MDFLSLFKLRRLCRDSGHKDQELESLETSVAHCGGVSNRSPSIKVPTLIPRSIFIATVSIIVVWLALFFLASPPTEAVNGQPLASFSFSTPADPPTDFSLEMRAHMEAGALHAEKLEFFRARGQVHVPTITKAQDGTVKVHVWAERPLIELVGTKCEFVRTLRFAISKSDLTAAQRLVLVNHDTDTVQVLAEAEQIRRLLGEPDRPSLPATSGVDLAKTGGGCGS